MIITIDGPAGSGKSTVAELISKKLNIIHFNSGALFRAITAFCLDNNIAANDLNKIANNIRLEIKFEDMNQHVLVNGIDYTPVLRNNEISTAVAEYATLPPVRTIIDKAQRDFAKSNTFVIEGRDTGSHVFPEAECKFYLDCSVDVRAERRFKEEQAKGNTISLVEIKQQIAERDYMDKTRNIAPLVIPSNATIVDSTNLNIEQVAEVLLGHINKISTQNNL